MLSGQDALLKIDRSIDEVRREADEAKGRLAGLNEREMALRGQMREALDDLARVRLDQARAGEIADSSAGIWRDVDRLMAERGEEREALDREHSALVARVAGLEERRAQASTEVGAASEALDAAAAALQDSLAKDKDYCAQQALAEKADKIAAEAEHKLSLAEADRKDKGAPYEADPLFMYLWSRGYGTPAYRGSGLVRMGDEWVARIVRFEDARRNYHMLTEIPKRLGDHAVQMREKAGGEVDRLAAIEAEARAGTDIPVLEEKLKDARGAVEAADAEIARAREDARGAEEKRAAMERGEDPRFRGALDAMVGMLDERQLAELKRDARRTRMPDDDRIVERLIEIEDDLDDVVDDRAELAEIAKRKAVRLTELEDMRVEFRRRRYDDYGSVFPDESLFGVVLTELVRGAITGAAYWNRLDRGHQRTSTHSRPDFGSGRFRFPGPLSFPGSRTSSRSGSGSRSGSRSGGFSRGGGFKTGGGF